jgi:hypothetical protein
MDCLKATFDYRCNPPFAKDKTEAGPVRIESEDDIDVVDETVYKEFTPPNTKSCAITDVKATC